MSEMKKTILVVEDIASIRQYVCLALTKKGYNTLKASSGNKAYTLLQDPDAAIDLVLTDYSMADGTGFELLERIKSNDQLSGIPVVFLTTESRPEIIKRAKEIGLAALIKKPYRAEQLFEQLEALLG